MADGTTSAEQLQCMTVWGGNGALQKWFALPALEVWVYNRPAGKQFGNTTCYVSSCASGRITRLLLAEPCGPEASVHGLSLQLGDLMAANVNQIQQKNFVRGLYETFTAAATDLGLATALVGSFFSPTRRLVYCNAGTPPPLTRAAGATQWVSLKGETASGGAADDAISATPPGVVGRDEYQYGTLTLETNDLVLMYNESLLEVRLEDGRVLGVEGFRELVQSTNAESPEQVVPAIVKSLQNTAQQDWNTVDLTMILCRCSETRTTWKANLLAPLRLLGSANKQLEFASTASVVPSNR
jgi:hypothetical protein